MHEVGGFPLDRTLSGLVGWRDLGTVVVVDSIRYEPSVRLRAAGGSSTVVTPVAARVTRTLFGRDPGARVRLLLAGGSVPGMEVRATQELAPARGDLESAPRVVVAGSLVSRPGLGTGLEPLFVYRLDDDGTLTSLLESASPDRLPRFSLTKLVGELRQRARASR